MPSSSRSRSLACLLLGLLSGACASSSESADSPLDEKERMKVDVYNPNAKLDTSGIGAYLTALDRSIQQWNALFLTGQQNRDMRKMRGLQDDLRHRTLKLFADIVTQLETGPPYNRRVAAAALGFSGHERARTALLNALSDPDPDVVSNALLGLAVLSDPLTPLSGVAHHLQFGSTEVIRSNASLATLEILRAGGEGGEDIVFAARRGLHDTDVFVRTQCALAIAHELDEASIADLTLQLHEDSANSAAMAAGRAIAYIGSKEITVQGQCARALTSSLGKVNAQVKASVLNDLRRLAGRNYSKDEDWVEWSHRLP